MVKVVEVVQSSLQRIFISYEYSTVEAEEEEKSKYGTRENT